MAAASHLSWYALLLVLHIYGCAAREASTPACLRALTCWSWLAADEHPSHILNMQVTSAANVIINSNVFSNNFCYPSAYNDHTFPFLVDGSLISLSNVVNVSGAGNRIQNPAKCPYLSPSPYAGSGTLGNVRCC